MVYYLHKVSAAIASCVCLCQTGLYCSSRVHSGVRLLMAFHPSSLHNTSGMMFSAIGSYHQVVVNNQEQWQNRLCCLGSRYGMGMGRLGLWDTPDMVRTFNVLSSGLSL